MNRGQEQLVIRGTGWLDHGEKGLEQIRQVPLKTVDGTTITVSDGISMGTPGMRYSLVSREIIADSIEAVAGAQGFDGLDNLTNLINDEWGILRQADYSCVIDDFQAGDCESRRGDGSRYEIRFGLRYEF
jgi:hypothetical protein